MLFPDVFKKLMRGRPNGISILPNRITIKRLVKMLPIISIFGYTANSKEKLAERLAEDFKLFHFYGPTCDYAEFEPSIFKEWLEIDARGEYNAVLLDRPPLKKVRKIYTTMTTLDKLMLRVKPTL